MNWHPDDSDSPAETALPSLSQCHPTDVMQSWTEAAGHQFFSVIHKVGGMLLVQDVEGGHWWKLPSTFVMRYSLKASGQFSIKWRVSPIGAVRQYRLDNPGTVGKGTQ